MPIVGKMEIKWHADKVTDATLNKCADLTNKSGKLIEKEAKRSIKSGSKSGRWYRGKSGKLYQASAPGEAPAIDTGSLYRSISTLLEKRKDGADAYIGTMDENKLDGQYKRKVSNYLELGTSKIQPRPFLRPALKKMEKKIRALFNPGKKGIG